MGERINVEVDREAKVIPIVKETKSFKAWRNSLLHCFSTLDLVYLVKYEEAEQHVNRPNEVPTIVTLYGKLPRYHFALESSTS